MGTGREIAVSDAEVNGDVQFRCSYTEMQGVYGTVSVDNELMVSHSTATADAEHVFTLENGMLKVEIPDDAGNGTAYKLVDGVLSVNPGFTGTITAEYAFTTSPTREIDFEYDHNGLRTQKKVVENGVTTIYDYTLNGKLITHLTKRVVDLEGVESSEEMHFFYDAQSRPAFVEYEGKTYCYIHNLQGDIVGILDDSGSLVVEYKYDAWGKPFSITGTLKTSLRELNPFRYRGYVYDIETGLYYLKSRFYQVIYLRFINADSVLGNIGSLDHNVYSYCKNSPIKSVDPDGKYARDFSSEKVLEYAEEHYLNYNPAYPRNGSDCANFVSQCLYAGGLRGSIFKWSYIKMPITNKKIKVTKAWGTAQGLFEYLKSRKFYYTEITTEEELSEAIIKNIISPGNPAFLAYKNGEVHHAVIIGSISDDFQDVYYYAHTTDRSPTHNSRSFSDVLKKEKIYIFNLTYN